MNKAFFICTISLFSHLHFSSFQLRHGHIDYGLFFDIAINNNLLAFINQPSMKRTHEHPSPKMSFLLAITCLLLFCLSTTVSSQTASKDQAANQLYKNKAYKAALSAYQDQPDQSTLEIERMAHSYRLNHDTQNAEKYYAQVVDTSYDPLVYLYYAQALQSNGKTELAKTYFLKYDEVNGQSGDRRGIVAATQLEEVPQPSNDIQLQNLQQLNSPYLDFSPIPYQNGIVFASTRQSEQIPTSKSNPADKWTGEEYTALYFSEKQEDGAFSTPNPFATALGAKFHQGPLTFSKKEDLFFYSQNVGYKNELEQKEQFLKIATAIKLGKKWLKDDEIDLGDYACNDVHPSLSTDGNTLYFASDRPGGYGGMDIYVTYFSRGKWSTPINLGKGVNSSGNEVFPFIFNNGSLYFSSDGRGGHGGLDVFITETSPAEDWQNAINLGAPINSNKDDFGYILHPEGKSGYFSSAREGGQGKDDLYQFNLSEKPSYQKSVIAHPTPPPGPTNSAKDSAPVNTPIMDTFEKDVLIELDDIYYDYGASVIRTDAAAELKAIVQFMQQQPQLSIELLSHTDARGAAAYNLELSQQRAQAAANYLIKEGISPNRIIPLGMGETKLLNDCDNDTDCTEAMHQINRRTEIRFIESK